MYGLRIWYADGSHIDCPWRFRTMVDLKAAFYEAESEDPSVRGWEVLAPNDAHPVYDR